MNFFHHYRVLKACKVSKAKLVSKGTRWVNRTGNGWVITKITDTYLAVDLYRMARIVQGFRVDKNLDC